MANIITRNENTVTVNRFIVGKARTALLELASKHNAQIDINDDKHYVATLETVELAKKFSTALARTYKAHNVTMPEPKRPTPARGDAPTEPTEPTEIIDKNAEKCKKALGKLAHTDDNSAAHKIMVAHGYKNSNSPEYQAIWRGYWWTIRK